MNKEKRAAEKRAARSHKEDVVLNRVLVWFGAAVVAELLLLLINRYYINYTTRPGEIEFAAALLHAFPIIIGVTAVAAVVCVVWAVMCAQKGKRCLLPGVLAWIFAALLVISAVTYIFSGTGVQFLCGLVPAAAVMALVYYLYQREFFVITVLSAMGIVGLWLIRRAAGNHQVVVYAYMAVTAVVLIAAALACRVMQKSDGFLTLGGKRLSVFNRGATYGMVYLTCAVVAVAVAAGLALGASAAYYLMIALVGWLFVMAVYYTVKLM